MGRRATLVRWERRTVWNPYYGITQPQVAAAKQPPPLKGFFTIEMCTDYFRHIVMFGGAPQVDFLALWLGANFTDTQVKLHVPPLVRALMSHVFNSPPLRHFWQPQVQKRMTRIMKNFQHKTPSKEIRELFATWVLDGKTRQTNSIPGDHRGRSIGFGCRSSWCRTRATSTFTSSGRMTSLRMPDAQGQEYG
jgi:hypothetical protein